MTTNKVIEIMRTGDFTIAYHDNDGGCFYKGKYKYEDLPEEADYEFDLYGHSKPFIKLYIHKYKDDSKELNAL
jgi:hypothetical protein